MDPLDDVVTHIHGIGSGRQYLHAEGILKARGFERLVPPVRALQQRAANGLGSSRVDVVDDGFDRFADGGVRIFLLQAMPVNQMHIQGRAERRGIVAIAGIEKTRTRIKGAWLIAIIRQLDEGIMFAQSNGVSVRRNRGYERAFRGMFGREGESGFKLAVEREVFGIFPAWWLQAVRLRLAHRSAEKQLRRSGPHPLLPLPLRTRPGRTPRRTGG